MVDSRLWAWAKYFSLSFFPSSQNTIHHTTAAEQNLNKKKLNKTNLNLTTEEQVDYFAMFHLSAFPCPTAAGRQHTVTDSISSMQMQTINTHCLRPKLLRWQKYKIHQFQAAVVVVGLSRASVVFANRACRRHGHLF